MNCGKGKDTKMNVNEAIQNPCENCKYIKDKQFYYFQNQLNESARYTSTIFTVAYVSLISMLGQVYKYLNSILLTLIVICLLFSIFLFVCHEIWCMKLREKKNKIMENTWTDFYNNKININELEREIYVKSQEARKVFSEWYEKIFMLTLASGLLSAFFLFLGCFIFLFKPVMLNLFQHLSSAH